MPLRLEPWTKRQETRLRQLWSNPNIIVPDMALILDKPLHRVKAKARKLRLPHRRKGGSRNSSSRTYITAGIRMGCGARTNNAVCLSCKDPFYTQYGRQRDRICPKCKDSPDWQSGPQFLIHT